MIALGLDAFERDPFGGLSVLTPSFAWMARTLATPDLPTVIVHEAGYLCDELGDH